MAAVSVVEPLAADAADADPSAAAPAANEQLSAAAAIRAIRPGRRKRVERCQPSYDLFPFSCPPIVAAGGGCVVNHDVVAAGSVRRNRSSTRTPNARLSTRTRSSTPCTYFW